MSTTLSNQITDDLMSVFYPEPSDEDKSQLAQVRQTILGVLTKHGVDRSAGGPTDNDANVINMLRQMIGAGGATNNSGSNKTKGPKKGTINCYHVYLKEHCDYPAWKEANPGQSYQAFQKAMTPKWEAFKQDKTQHDALKAKAAAQSAAKISS